MRDIVEWPYDKALQLIRMFQQRPVLWDFGHDDYKDRRKRNKTMSELAKRFHVSKAEIERKLSNLQSHFRREVRKEKMAATIPNKFTVYRSKWFAYQALRFLLNRNRPRQSQAATVGSDALAAQRRKSRMADVAMSEVSDKSRQCVVMATRLEDSDIPTKLQPLRSPPVKAITHTRTKKAAYTVNGAAFNNFVYVDANQQSKTNNSQINYWNEMRNNVDGQDSIGFATETGDEARQSQNITDFRNAEPNESAPVSSFPSSADKRNYKVISEDMILPTINFLLAEAKARDSNQPELNFYRSLIPDIMKLSEKRRREFKETMLHSLHDFLDQEEDECSFDRQN
ncbi:uncharacterized protein LOC105181274 [Harpegnathos saltator]|uniref:MADF domain-containing protein n=1 Tax=Harpegnathos saltator TaxID=610380 RepID=E2BCD5_HARSA|nr:uncharacterized protein LOC105181274 [Harpegnathos saltator]EFN86671.1 hypothetical protein EAI_03706 [Harpegnathos saltator]